MRSKPFYPTAMVGGGERRLERVSERGRLCEANPSKQHKNPNFVCCLYRSWIREFVLWVVILVGWEGNFVTFCS
jgi:hypothetical protein